LTGYRNSVRIVTDYAKRYGWLLAYYQATGTVRPASRSKK
jgi:hypothetical protein